VTVPQVDRELLLVAAWLHDIGYSPRLHRTGFHPLDGANFLAHQGWPIRLASLVAHHSGARFVAAELKLLTQLDGFADERSAVTDALGFADQTTGPQGQPMSVDERLRDALRRHGKDSPQAHAFPQRGPHLTAMVARVQKRLAVAPSVPRAGSPAF
jgi:hypothetical protein